MEDRIKVAVAGVGNLVNGLVQGIKYYSDHKNQDDLLHPKIGGFQIEDIKVVAAFDIDERKVGKDLSEAIFAAPNKMDMVVELETTHVIVQKSPTLDGVAETARGELKVSDSKDVDVVKVLENSGAEMLVIATPSGAVQTAEMFAEAALKAKIGVINATPTPLARNSVWARKFREASLPILGDDLQSQAGGTSFHKGLLQVLKDIGVHVKETYQLDVSGGLEGLTTLDFDRRNYKRSVKEHSIKQALDYNFEVAAGTTDYLEFLGSLRIGNYWVAGKGFLGQPVTLDIRMESVDGSNGAASLADAIRTMKIAINTVAKGPVSGPAPYLFKAPPVTVPLAQAKTNFEGFISGKNGF